MQKRTISSQLITKVGEEVRIKGWLHTLRELGKVNFLLVRDRGGITQVVIENKDEIAKLKGMQTGTVLDIHGTVVATKSTSNGVELTNPEITVVVPITEVAPIDITKQDVNVDIDTALDYRPVVLRHPKQAAVFKIQANILQAYAESMRRQGFTEFRTPLLMPSASESGADVFEVKYFDGKAYLAQSPQIHKQIMIGVFERVFTIATIFRAEKHNTSRHLMEVTQMDGEMAFIDSYQDVLAVVEQVVRDIFAHLEQHCATELEMWDAKLPKLPGTSFPQVKVREALGIIAQRTGKSAEREELDLDPEDEREICKWALEEHGSDFVWLLNFKRNKNFYTWNNPEDDRESLSYDLACRGLEWLSGTHRINTYQTLVDRMLEIGLKPEQYDHYLQAFKFGMPAEAGFSFGLERMTKQILSMENVREATLFPSDLKRISGTRISREVIKGGVNVRNAILALLQSRAVKFDHFEHAEVITAQEAAQERGTKLSAAVKSLILVNKQTGEHALVGIPGNKKLDFKRLQSETGQKWEMEKPDVILQKFGLQVGGVPPYGALLHIPVYLDISIQEQEEITFSCGLKTESITLSSKDLVETTEAKLVGVAI